MVKKCSGDTKDERWQEYVDEIRLHVYEMANLPPDIRKLFKSDMRIVVDCLAEGKDYVPSKQRIVHLEALLLMLRELTGDERLVQIISSLQEDEKEMGGMSMFELLDKYESRGLERGRAEAKFETVLKNIVNLMNTMSLTAEQAMNALLIPEEERADYMAKL